MSQEDIEKTRLMAEISDLKKELTEEDLEKTRLRAEISDLKEHLKVTETLLEQLLFGVADRFAQKIDMPKNKGDTIRLRRSLKHSKKTTARQDGPGQPVQEISQEDMEKTRLRAEISDLKEHLKVTETLLEQRDKLLDAFPSCPMHGKGCISYAVEWVNQVKTLGKIILGDALEIQRHERR